MQSRSLYLSRIGNLPEEELAWLLANSGVVLNFGLIRARIKSEIRGLAHALGVAYSQFVLDRSGECVDVTVSLTEVRSLRRYIKRQTLFFVEGQFPFEPFPADTHFPLLEWGLNWCIARRCNQHLMLHAGVVAEHDRALILPGVPGSGKSTLTAALVSRGFRLLSDEFGIVRFTDGALLPLVRPIALKNQSMHAIRKFSPHSILGPVFPKTRKGDIAHMAPNQASVDSSLVAARPVLVIFPKYKAGAQLDLTEVPKARGFAKVSSNSFNYEMLGVDAFNTVGKVITASNCYRLQYGNLDQAVSVIADLMAKGQ